MTIELNTVLVIGLGVFLQGFLLAAQKREWKKLAYIAGFSLIPLIPTDIDYIFDEVSFLAAYLLFSWLFALAFQKTVLPRVSELSLIPSSLILLYLGINNYETLGILKWLLLPITAGTIFTFWQTLATQERPSRPIKGIMYSWYLTTDLIILGLLIIMLQQHSGTSWALSWMLFGMNWLYFMTRLWHLIFLIPIPSKSTPLEKAIQSAKQQAIKLSKRYSPKQANPREALQLTLILSALITINHWLSLISAFAVINLVLISPQVMMILKKKRIILRFT